MAQHIDDDDDDDDDDDNYLIMMTYTQIYVFKWQFLLIMRLHTTIWSQVSNDNNPKKTIRTSKNYSLY